MPKTYFLHPGKATLEQLIKNGITLWHEEAESRSSYELKDLWRFAQEMSDNAQDEPADSVCLLIACDNLVPASWKSDTPFPYKGLFISSFYFIEAQKLFKGTEPERAWPSVVQAYYYLGMNSSPMISHESGLKAARTRHERNSEAIRAIIVNILRNLGGDKSVKSGAGAIKRVLDAIDKSATYTKALNAFDEKSSEKTKTDRDKKLLDRFKDRLVEWTSPGSPYPDILDAIQPFKQKRKR